MPEQPEELVLALDSAALARLFAERAGRADAVWLPADKAPVESWLPSIRKAFLPRSMAEDDPTWRHVITYTLLTSGDRVFTYRRGESGSEGRLHGRLSLGVGGHVTVGDYDADTDVDWWLMNAACREVEEELVFRVGVNDYGVTGFIASSASAVDRVHLAFVSTIRVKAPSLVSVREDCLAAPAWRTKDDLWQHQDLLESWSRITAREVLGIPIGEGRP